MSMQRPFRFGIGAISAASRDEWVAFARKVESLGYSTLATGDHISLGGLAPLPALLAAADATTSLRIATAVLTKSTRAKMSTSARSPSSATPRSMRYSTRLGLPREYAWVRCSERAGWALALHSSALLLSLKSNALPDSTV